MTDDSPEQGTAGGDSRTPGAAIDASPQSGTTAGRRRRRPLYAFLLSLLNPGLGFVYLTELRTGLIISVLALSYSALGVYTPILCRLVTAGAYFLLGIGGIVAVLIVASRRARTLGEVALRSFNRAWFYVAYVIAFAAFGYVSMPELRVTVHLLPTSSMEPTLRDGERVAVDHGCYDGGYPAPGDVIMFRWPKDPEQLYLKRCVALGGQTVLIRGGVVFVDGKRFMPSLRTENEDVMLPPGEPETLIYPPGAGNRDNYGPLLVPKDSIFVLGDNRGNSLDSRYWGFVHRDAVLGKAIYVAWSSARERIGRRVE